VVILYCSLKRIFLCNISSNLHIYIVPSNWYFMYWSQKWLFSIIPSNWYFMYSSHKWLFNIVTYNWYVMY
jgi:hypothetical protein